MTLFDRFDRMRRGADVRRYHTHRVDKQQTVGAHSWGVAVLCDLLWVAVTDSPTPYQLLVGALHHDVAEYDSGDSPAWVKRRCPELKAALDGLEHEAELRLGLVVTTAFPTYTAFLKVADELEFLWYCLDERRGGNTEVDVMFARGVLGVHSRLAQLAPSYPVLAMVASTLVLAIRGAYVRLAPEWLATLTRVDRGEDYFSRVASGKLDEEGES